MRCNSLPCTAALQLLNTSCHLQLLRYQSASVAVQTVRASMFVSVYDKSGKDPIGHNGHKNYNKAKMRVLLCKMKTGVCIFYCIFETAA